MTDPRSHIWQAQFWTDAWYQGRWWLHALRPLSGLFWTLAKRRRQRLQENLDTQLPVPVIVVGNISLGGTGKTPLLIAIASFLKKQGYKPGIISRGYGGNAESYPRLLNADSKAEEVGDEPLLIQLETGCPVAVGPERVKAAQLLLQNHQCDILLSDDGLQHYRLPRDIEIAVIDGERGLGNGLCLPAGPLREAPVRLQEVDLVVVNGDTSRPLPAALNLDYFSMTLAPNGWHSLLDNSNIQDRPPVTDKTDRPLAIAGIGNPERFFSTLKQWDIEIEARAFPDHYKFTAADFADFNQRSLFMTAKDAVKCREFAEPNWWYLAVEAQLSPGFWARLTERIQSVSESAEHTTSPVKA